MNLCIVSSYNCTFDDFSALVKESEEAFSEFITEYEVVKVNDHKSISSESEQNNYFTSLHF